jgi:transposase
MGKHLQKEERIKIQTLLDVGKSIDEISVYLNRHRSTIYREMNRGRVSNSRNIMPKPIICSLEQTWCVIMMIGAPRKKQ